MAKKVFEKVIRWFQNRFAALRWPLTSLPQRTAATRPYRIMNTRAAAKLYPIRGLRYWWIQCALLDEIGKRKEDTVVADVGCSRGHIKRFIGDVQHTKWVGLDWKVDDTVLRECGYSELHQCDFDNPLPLSDNSVDIVVFSHVIEHLPRPDFAMGEISRILRPNGLLIAGSPVAPSLIAKVREWHHRRRRKLGKIKPGGHINSMSIGRWKNLVQVRGLNVEVITGTFLTRWSDNPLENKAWWARLNQLWGAFFPALGGEIYMTARKALSAHAQPELVYSKATGPLVLLPKWAWGMTGLFIFIGILGASSLLMTVSCPIQSIAIAHQDGNDSFYIMASETLNDVKPHRDIRIIRQPGEIEYEHQKEAARGMDAHFLLSVEDHAEHQVILSRMGLCVVKKVEINGNFFVLLSSEIYA